MKRAIMKKTIASAALFAAIALTMLTSNTASAHWNVGKFFRRTKGRVTTWRPSRAQSSTIPILTIKRGNESPLGTHAFLKFSDLKFNRPLTAEEEKNLRQAVGELNSAEGKRDQTFQNPPQWFPPAAQNALNDNVNLKIRRVWELYGPLEPQKDENGQP